MRHIIAAACAALLACGVGGAQAATAVPDVNGVFQIGASFHDGPSLRYNIQQIVVDVTLDPLIAVNFDGTYDYVQFAEYDGPHFGYNADGDGGFSVLTSVSTTSTGYQLILHPPQTDALCYPVSVLTSCGTWYYDQVFYVFGQGSSDQPVDYQIAFHEIRRSHIYAPIPEPATWALAVIGFGLVGSAMRRRRVGASVTMIKGRL